MTEQKPERIWAFPSVAFGWISGSWKHVGNTDGTEYILASTVATLIAQARAEGRREGLEEAANLMRKGWKESPDSRAIRALIDKDKT